MWVWDSHSVWPLRGFISSISALPATRRAAYSMILLELTFSAGMKIARTGGAYSPALLRT